MHYPDYIDALRAAGNLRSIPSARIPEEPLTDLSGNDYMGFAATPALQEEFMEQPEHRAVPLSASASRLLASPSVQAPFQRLEQLLTDLYGRPALLFNSGYHANTGLVSALADPKDTVILADRLVHASIIDGIRLSGAPFERFRHNDVAHLDRLAARHRGKRLLVVTESVFSMDGDAAPLEELAAWRHSRPEALLYVDEAHAVGAVGKLGLGLAAEAGVLADVDVLVGTFGKAYASQGAFASFASPLLREVAVNSARSLIFSTALSPLTAAWTAFVIRHSLGCDDARSRLAALSERLRALLGMQQPAGGGYHIVPFIVGDAARTVELSRRLRLRHSLQILPIRTPTVPPGTERLRISLNALLTPQQIEAIAEAITTESRLL